MKQIRTATADDLKFVKGSFLKNYPRHVVETCMVDSTALVMWEVVEGFELLYSHIVCMPEHDVLVWGYTKRDYRHMGNINELMAHAGLTENCLVTLPAKDERLACQFVKDEYTQLYQRKKNS
jgi:hypothetical protein